jgi:hypothetical protein
LIIWYLQYHGAGVESYPICESARNVPIGSTENMQGDCQIRLELASPFEGDIAACSILGMTGRENSQTLEREQKVAKQQ